MTITIQKDREDYELQRQQGEEESDPTPEGQENSTVSIRQTNDRNPILCATERERWINGPRDGSVERCNL